MASGMTRREFLGAAAVGSAALLGLPAFGAESGTKRPPNFVIIYIDDLGYQDVGCFGAPLIKTPNVDRMAAEGMKFTSFYAQPVCSPSRAALLTGCYPMRVGIPNVLFPKSKTGISDYEKTIGDVLKEKGYATACIGKWHLGHQPQFLPTRHGFDYYFGIPYSNDMGRTKNNNSPELPLMRNETVIEAPAKQDTLTQRYTQEAIAFIERSKDKPFFLYLPHTMVHVPLAVSDGFKGKSQQGLYGDAVEEVDWSAGQILDALKRLGLDDNTMVVFTSDNGPWLNKKEDGGSALPLREGKGTTYEGGVRVPMVVRWPGHVPAGTVCESTAMNMDLLPTIAKLAGTSAPTDRIIDGGDIWPLMAGKMGARSAHDAIFYYSGPRLQAVRWRRWKLILPIVAEKKPSALYDLGSDISETTDVAARYPKIVVKLQEIAEKCREDLGDSITGRTGKNCRPPGTVGPSK